jgi:hypothetical protein
MLVGGARGLGLILGAVALGSGVGAEFGGGATGQVTAGGLGGGGAVTELPYRLMIEGIFDATMVFMLSVISGKGALCAMFVSRIKNESGATYNSL